MQAVVTETVDAHRLEKLRELLAYEKLATFGRMNGYDRGVDREYDWGSLPPTPREFYASLRSDFQKLKDAISMPAENTVTRPWQKTIVRMRQLRQRPKEKKGLTQDLCYIIEITRGDRMSRLHGECP